VQNGIGIFNLKIIKREGRKKQKTSVCSSFLLYYVFNCFINTAKKAPFLAVK